MNGSRLLIRGGRIIDPMHGIDEVADLAIESGEVTAIGPLPAGFQADQVLDASGCMVCPGLVDLHAHLREPGFEHKGNIDSETRAAVKGGITTVCALPDTQPIVDSPAVVQLILDRAEAAARAQVVPLGALTLGQQGETLSEMYALKQVGCQALYQSSGTIRDSQILSRAMEYAATHDLLVVLKPEDWSLRDGGCVHDGVVSARLGLPGIPSAAETVAVAQILALVAQYRVRVHLTQLSTGQAVDLLRHAREHGLPVTADVSVHQLLLNEHHVGDFDPAYHLDPPLRSETDRLRLQAGVAEGLIDAISSGHSPHELEAKQEAFPATAAGLSGFETLLSLSLMLVEQDVLSLSQLVERLSSGPANIHRLACGGLAVGQPADVCVFDPNQRWTVDESTWLSRGRNTPFMGQQLPGVVRYTIVQGQLVYQGE